MQQPESIKRPPGRPGTSCLAARRLAAFGKSLWAVFVPQLCVGCETTVGPLDGWLCRDCTAAVSSNARPRSRTVALAGGRTLGISYALDYNPVVSRVVTQMKYADKPGLAALLAPFMDFALAGPVCEGTAVMPVPIHASKRRERGYNQSELLANLLAPMRGLKVDADCLLKMKNTVSQTRLERQSRIRNVTGSFGIRRSHGPVSARALLIDDVVTTGSTLRECAEAVLAAGAREVSACVVASSQ